MLSRLSHGSKNIHFSRFLYISVLAKANVPRSCNSTNFRGIKTRVNEKLSLSELPSLKVTSKELKKLNISQKKDTQAKLPPALQEIRNYIDQYPEKVVLTEVGKFYELYFENADIYAPKLGLKLTKRSYGLQKVSFAGFPIQSCLKFMRQLVEDHSVSVVIIKQYVEPENALTNIKKIRRKIFRIITPGTVIEEDFLDGSKNNFVASLCFTNNFVNELVHDYKYTISWCDISTTELYVETSKLSNLINDLQRIKPTELIIHEKFQNRLSFFLGNLLDKFKITWISGAQKGVPSNFFAYYNMFNERNAKLIENSFQEMSKMEANAIILLLDYVKMQFQFGNEYIDLSKDDNTLRLDNDGDSLQGNSNENMNIYDETTANIGEVLRDVSFNFSLPVRSVPKQYMLIDSSAREALEITETIKKKGSKNTMFNTINRTVTPSATRMLRSWLDSPPYNLVELKNRLKIVKSMNAISFSETKYKVLQILKKLGYYDTLRLMFSIGFNTSSLDSSYLSYDIMNIKLASNYLNLLNVLDFYSEIKKTILEYDLIENNPELNELVTKINVPLFLRDTIEKIINKDNLESLHEKLAINEEDEDIEYDTDFVQENDNSTYRSFGRKKRNFPDMTWIINYNNIDDQNSNLQIQHETLQKQLRLKEKLEEKTSKICEEYSIKSFELRIDNDLPNIYIQYSGKMKADIITLREAFDITFTSRLSKTTLSFMNKEWTLLGCDILSTIKKIKLEELRYLNKLKHVVLENFNLIKNTSLVVDKLDIFLSFSNLSLAYNLVEPKLNNEIKLDITNGRHLMVENSLKRSAASEFQPNDCNISARRLPGYVISGPNMGGKSTYLRQNALIIILAQIGCYVPADSANIGIVDKIFTRIGASDDISNNSSTFMLEMTETSKGLNNATRRSMLIFDEIGRGTSNNEGISIAFGILKYIVEELKCRFLFATHYAPELHKLLQNDDKDKGNSFSQKISYYHTALLNDRLDKFLDNRPDKCGASISIFNGRFFDHKLKPGISEYSHATTIAKLAGVPPKVLQNAQIALAELKKE